MDVSKLTLHDVMLHAIAKTGFTHKQENPPELSDVPAPLDAKMSAFLEEKIKKALREKARPITEDVATGAKAAQEVRQYLQASPGDRDLAATSRELATLLHLAQPGIAPQGIVLVAHVEWAGSPGILLAKLDREVGLRTGNFTKNAEGLTTVTVEYLEDLFVTDATKVFKIGYFAAADIDKDVLHGQIVDVQVQGNGAAHYFLQYLGCGFSQRPQELTEHFANAATGIINSGIVKDPEKRARYTVALISELQSQGPDLNVHNFARQHLDAGDRDPFISAMTQAGVPQGPIAKDTGLIETRLKRVQIETERDVFIMAPPERIDDGTIVVEPGTDGAPDRVLVKDQVRRVANHS